MATQLDYTERFMVNAELYMLLTKKRAEDLTVVDIDRIKRHVDFNGQYIELPESCCNQRD